MGQLVDGFQVFLKCEGAADKPFLLLIDLDVNVVVDWRLELWLNHLDLFVRAKGRALPVGQVHLLLCLLDFILDCPTIILCAHHIWSLILHFSTKWALTVNTVQISLSPKLDLKLVVQRCSTMDKVFTETVMLHPFWFHQIVYRDLLEWLTLIRPVAHNWAFIITALNLWVWSRSLSWRVGARRWALALLFIERSAITFLRQ